MVAGDGLRVRADFNYGGRDDAGRGILILAAKQGAKDSVSELYAGQLKALGVDIRVGLELVLWDNDRLDDGTPAYLEVDAVVGYDPTRLARHIRVGDGEVGPRPAIHRVETPAECGCSTNGRLITECAVVLLARRG
jgi:hypothetical protein